MVEIKKQTITALVPAFNEEKNIERCVKSVLWCNRILVLWMGNDTTGKIARQLGAEIVELNKNIQPDFTAVQKNINWAIDRATTDWILRIDADEEVTQELKEEIQQVIAKGGSCENNVAYRVPRNQYFWGGFLKGGDWYYDRLVRLFKPQFARYDPIVPVHEQFKVDGPVGFLKNRLNHYSHPTLRDAINKFQLYTDIEAAVLKTPKYIIFFKMIAMPVYVFGRWFFWHHGYRDGIRGLAAGLLRGWYEFLLYSKALRR